MLPGMVSLAGWKNKTAVGVGGGGGGVWLCLCQDQGTPSAHVRGVLKLGVFQGLNLSPWCKPLLGSGNCFMGTLECRQGAGSTLVHPTLWLFWSMVAGLGVVVFTGPLLPVFSVRILTVLFVALRCLPAPILQTISFSLLWCKEKSMK